MLHPDGIHKKGAYMGVIQFIKDWVNFRAMVTPVLLKLVFQFLFWVTNILGVLGLIGVLLMGVLAAVGIYSATNGEVTTAAISLGITLLSVVLGFVVLIIYNLALRAYFEIILLFFNIYDSLLSIERKLDLKAADDRKINTGKKQTP